MAARLAPDFDPDEIAIVDPSEDHFYQPLWTLAGAGVAKKESTLRKNKNLIPKDVTWIKKSVAQVEPDLNLVALSDGSKIGYQVLVVATGLRLNWEKIEGLGEKSDGNSFGKNLGQNGIHSIYEYSVVDKCSEALNNFKGGTAIFVMPPVPIKCAGAPQKIMYLAENIFRNNGVREKSKVIFATAGKAMFGIPAFGDALNKIRKEKGIEALFLHKLLGVNSDKKKAIFEVTGSDGQVSKQELDYDFLHVVPTMSAHSYVAESGLAFESGDQKGWLAVDKFSLQHLKFSNIFGIGDVTGVPNSKTGAAIRMQAPVVAANVMDFLRGTQLQAQYDGYSSCPLVTEIGKVMLAEFGYDGVLMPSFPLDPRIPRRSYWHLKKDFLPSMYWHGMMKGWL